MKARRGAGVSGHRAKFPFRLTDGRGRTTYFHNSIIVLTSNLGTRSARGKLGLGPVEDELLREDRRYRDAVLGAFRPELINRLDQIVVFHPLQAAEIARVAEIAVERLAERRGFTQSGVILDISERALATLADHGFSPDLGARALRRHLEGVVMAPAARLLAKAGAEGHGGTLTVRTPDELVSRPPGSKLGESTEAGVIVTLWRRASVTGRRLVRSAVALGGLRRDTDRELALPASTGVRDKIGELEATLATATAATGAAKLPGQEIARLTHEHALLVARWNACTAAQAELRTAEELCLEALAKDIDAVDLIDGAVAAREKFRRDLFWLLVALRAPGKGATLLVHTPDARPALLAWLHMILASAEHHGWQAAVHLWNEQAPGWKPTHAGAGWGPPHDRAWAEDHLKARMPVSALVRITGLGADLLYGLEAGLHRLHGVAGEAAHVWVDLLEPRTDFKDEEWAALPGPPTPRAPRGAPMREVVVGGDRTVVVGEELDLAWPELPTRLEEAAIVRLLKAHAKPELLEALWIWERPLQALERVAAAQEAAE